MGPNFSQFKNITLLLEKSMWTEMHYSQCFFVHNAFAISHPHLREKNVKFVQIYLYQALLVTSPVLRLLTPSAFLQLWTYTSELSSLKSLVSYLFSGKISCHFFEHASFNSLNLRHSNQYYQGKWYYLSVNFLYSPGYAFSLFLAFNTVV